MTETVSDIRQRLLLAALEHVAFDGWTEAAIQAGARDLGLDPAQVLNAFPGGPRELIEAFSTSIDARTLAALERQDLTEMRVRDRIALGVCTRLDLLAPHREAVRRSLAFLALPHNAALAARLLWRTVDALWYAAGDTATDYNYYSKRALLSGVYSSTLLCWLNDSSEGQSATWAFLNRKIDEVMRIGGRLGKTVKRLMDLPDAMLRRRTGIRPPRR